MALTDYRPDAMRCTRCSYCKWIPFDLVQEPPLRQGLPLRRGGQVPRLLGRRQADHRAQPHGRAQRGHRPGRRRRLPLPALRQLRRDLQALPLRHGADPRAARAARPPGGDGPRARLLPPADRDARGRASPAQGAEDPRRPQRLGRGPRPRRPGDRARRRRLLRRLQVLARGEPPRDGAHPGAPAPARRPHGRPLRERLLRRHRRQDGLPRRGRRGRRPGCSRSGPRPASRPWSRPAPTAATSSRASTPTSRAARRCPRCCTPSSSPTGWSRTGASSSPRPSR